MESIFDTLKRGQEEVPVAETMAAAIGVDQFGVDGQDQIFCEEPDGHVTSRVRRMLRPIEARCVCRRACLPQRGRG